MKGAFFGHDHMNSFLGTDDNGITLGGCKAATYNSYNDGDAGCRIIEIKPDATYTSETQTVSSFSMAEPVSSTENDLDGAVNVPPVIYAGASGNGVAQQKFASADDSVIQTYLLDQETKLLSPADLDIDFDLPGASDFNLTLPSGVTFVVTKNVEGSFAATITGGPATVGEPLEYTLTYMLGGTQHIKKAFSCVDNISSAPGYYIFTRQYRNGESKNWCSNQYVVTLSGIKDGIYTVYGESRDRISGIDPSTEYAGGGTFNGTAFSSWDNRVGYYNFTSNSDSGFNSMGDNRYALNYFSPTRSLSTCHWKRNSTAGQSPVANVYVDESTVRSVNDLNLKLTYFIHTDTDNSLPIYIRPVGFFTGDSDYTHATANIVDNYDSSFVPSSENYGSTAVEGLTSTLTAGSKIIGFNGYSRGETASVGIVGSSLPSDGDEYTLVGAAYSSYNSGGDYPHQNYTYTPILVRFSVVDKSALRQLVNYCRLADIDTEKAEMSTYASYLASFKAAIAVLYKGNATENEIVSSANRLHTNIDLVEKDTDNISGGNGEFVPTATAFPDYIYVAGENTVAAQTCGTNIQTQVLNHHTKTMVDYNTSFSLELPAGTTSATLTASSLNSSLAADGTVLVSSSFNPETHTISGRVTGGTSSAGDFIMYRVDYVLAAKTYSYADGSYVCNIPMPVGWYVHTRSTFMSGVSNSYTQVFAPTDGYFVNGVNITADPANSWSNGTTTGESTNPLGTIDYTTPGAGDGAFKPYYVSGNEKGGMLYWSPAAALNYNWYCGKNSGGGSDSAERRAFALICIDSSRVLNVESAKYSMTLTRTSAYAPRDGMYNSEWGFISGADKEIPSSAGALPFIGVGEGDQTLSATEGNSVTVNFTSGSEGGLPSDGSVVTFGHTMRTYSSSKWQNNTHTGSEFRFLITDSSALRTAVAAQRAVNRAVSDGYDEASFENYLKVLAKVSAASKDPRNSAAVMSAMADELSSTVVNIVYEDADYTALYDALDAAIYDNGTADGKINRETGLYSGELSVIASAANEFKPDGVNDIYVGNAYAPAMYVNSAVQLMNLVSSRSALYVAGSFEEGTPDKLDCRCQTLINNAAASLLELWNATLLDSADYSGVNAMLAKYTPGDAFSDNKSKTYFEFSDGGNDLSADFAETFFLKQNGYDNWETAVQAVIPGYKKPDSATVSGYADALSAAYAALTVRFAGEYYEGSYSAGGVDYNYEGTSLKDEKAVWQTVYSAGNGAVAAQKPGTAQTTPVKLYNEAQWTAFVTAYDAAAAEYSKDYATPGSLRAKMPSADRVTSAVTALHNAGEALTYAPAFFDYLNAEKAAKAYYEVGGDSGRTQGGEYYYTAETWQAYTSALEAAGAQGVSNFNSSAQATVNALAKGIYDAREALELKALDTAEASEALAAATASGYDSKVEVLLNPSLAAGDPAKTQERFKYTAETRQAVSDAFSSLSTLVSGSVQNSSGQPALDNAISDLNAAVAALEPVAVYTDGWDFIASNLNAVYGGNPVTMGNLHDYYAQYLTAANIERINTDVQTLLELTTTLQQAELNALAQGLYDYLTTTPAQSVELNAAKAAAAAEKNKTLNVKNFDDSASTDHYVYSPDSRAACENALNLLTLGSIYASTPAASADKAVLARKTAGIGGETDTLLELNGAFYTYLNDAVTAANSQLSATAEVADPADAVNNFDIPLYGTDAGNATRKALSDKLASLDYSLLTDSQSDVNAAEADVRALTGALAFGPADFTFVNAQLALLAAFETGGSEGKTDIGGANAGAHFYTATTWAAYTSALEAARTAAAAGDTANNQAAVNALAKAIFDSRAALVLNDFGSVSQSVITVAPVTYTGSVLTPEVTVTIGSLTLVHGRDYKVEYSNNVNAGTQAVVKITGLVTYSGTNEAFFTISKADASAFTAEDIPDTYFDTTAHTPAPVVSFGTMPLTAGTDYNVTYSENTAAGIGKVLVEGIGNFKNTKEFTFKILAAPADSLTITPLGSFSFSGKDITPAVEVKFGETPLTAGTDYDVEYSPCKNVGTVTVTVTFKGNYEGVKQTAFEIVAADSALLTVDPIADITFTGSALTPAPVVRFGGDVLTKDVDYTVSYSNNTQVGTASVKVEGIGNFTGEKTVFFNISPIKTDGIYVNDNATVLFKHDVQLGARISPENATNKNIRWSSENNGIASVDQNGKVTGRKTGKTNIIVTAEDTGITASCTVTVKYAWWQWLIVIFLFGWIWY